MVKRDISAIESIIKYSKDCILMRFVKNHLKKSLFLLNRLPSIIPSKDDIEKIIAEIDIRLSEKESVIGNLFIPMLEGRDFNYKKDGRFSFTKKEIEDGYILLKEVCRRDPHTGEIISYKQPDFIILLRPFKSSESGFEYISGVLYEIGPQFLEKDLDLIPKSMESLLSNELLKLIITKKSAYGYLE